MGLVCLAAACISPFEPPVPPSPPPLTGAGPFVVSNAVATGAAGVAPAGTTGLGPLTYISLPPGSLPSGTAVSIRVERTGTMVSAPLLDGGLDPVAVAALAGDTISLTVEPAGVVASVLRFTVSIRKPPVIVRTRPVKNKRDVPLNIRIEVIFSEPIDSTSLTPLNFELRSGGTPVAGQLGFANGDHTAVEFTPAEDLAAAADYELVVRAGIRDLDGASLENGESVSFTTATPVAQVPVPGEFAFVRDGQIHLVDSEGSVTQLTHTEPGVRNEQPIWSPDGQRLAFARNRGGLMSWDIHVMNADGSNEVQLTHGGYNVDPAWSPDGRTIGFTSLQNGSAGVFVIDAGGGASRVLINRLGYDADPAWSPDGRKITFTSDWRSLDGLLELWIMNGDGSDPTLLLEAPTMEIDGIGTFWPWTMYVGSAWSPDGQRIAVSIIVDVPVGDPHASPPQWDRTQKLLVANADGSGVRVIAETGAPGGPTWSPDGRTVAFNSSNCPGSQSCLRFVRVDGGGEGLILNNGHSPAWRP